ncbi:hypothetical protein [Frateuria aurantia]|uniref:hypothetical protein n=1 Tax=Frateuria aurantia TaxID=81475 RepID=UPI0012EAB3BC|nr:hypothetical protein [Frateuria aurantia]
MTKIEENQPTSKQSKEQTDEASATSNLKPLVDYVKNLFTAASLTTVAITVLSKSKSNDIWADCEFWAIIISAMFLAVLAMLLYIRESKSSPSYQIIAAIASIIIILPTMFAATHNVSILQEPKIVIFHANLSGQLTGQAKLIPTP